MLDGRSSHEAKAESNICTNTFPTSRPTHSSKIVARNSPQAVGSTDRSVTTSPSWKPVSLSRSTIGMNWMCSMPSTSRK